MTSTSGMYTGSPWLKYVFILSKSFLKAWHSGQGLGCQNGQREFILLWSKSWGGRLLLSKEIV